ncbi:MAG: sigma-70 family RNA polymerase sigma factor [Chlamydiota bacterium]|nr:sigma-70 family RNA polymerase sigma factor [Chlamydiota bacterium]
MESYSDQQLIQAFRDGNESAFEELVLRHRNRVYCIFVNILHDTELAWDGTQEAFIKIYKNIHTFKGNCPAGGWIYRVAMNHALNMLRKRRWIRQEVPYDESTTQNAIYSAKPEEKLIENEFNNQKLSKHIHCLPKVQKAVIILRHFSQLSFKEIGETLHKSEETVKSNHYYAIMKLRRKLTKET